MVQYVLYVKSLGDENYADSEEVYKEISFGGTSGEKTYTLVTDGTTLNAGDKIVIACNSKGFVAGNISSSIMTNIQSTFSADKNTITNLGDGAVELTLGGDSSAWTFTNADGKLLGATAAKKVAWDNGTKTWTITIDKSTGNATIQNGTSTYGKFLYNVSSPRFTTYTSSPTTSMLLPQIYRLE